MVSLFAIPNCSLVFPRLLLDLNFTAISVPVPLVHSPRDRRQRRTQSSMSVSLESSSGGFGDLRRRHIEGSWCCWCKGWESEGDPALEEEILEFMKQSEKPEAFPTKRELVDAGRMDLAEAIARRGGWLSLGWDLEEDNDEEELREIGGTAGNCDGGLNKVQRSGLSNNVYDSSVITGRISSDFQEGIESRDIAIGDGVGRLGVSSTSGSTSQSPASSGGSLEIREELQTGIEGILNRLEKERNLSLGISLVNNGYFADSMSKDSRDDSHIETAKDSIDLGRSTSSPNEGIFDNSGGKFGHGRSVLDFRSSLKPEKWQTWSIQRAGLADAEFEAAEISFNDNHMYRGEDALKDEILGITEVPAETLVKQKDINHHEIKTRLQNLELELSSALRILRSKRDKFVSVEGHETSKDLQKLSDTWEFQENEIMNAQDKLRSIRAKIAVLEGKMALAIIDAQKIFEEKQKQIEGAHRALQLLRSTSMVWPNSASEVLLAGSFDGWTTKRKMEKSSTGIFSVCLKLYPGRYEIKFIVDGMWKTDPLRPIVHNNGYENNLLIVT